MLPCLFPACCAPPNLRVTVGWVCVSAFGLVYIWLFTFAEMAISPRALSLCLQMRRARLLCDASRVFCLGVGSQPGCRQPQKWAVSVSGCMCLQCSFNQGQRTRAAACFLYGALGAATKQCVRNISCILRLVAGRVLPCEGCTGSWVETKCMP